MSEEDQADWYTRSQEQIARAKRIAREMHQSNDLPTAERAEELQRLAEEVANEPRPTAQDKAAMLGHLQDKYGRRPRKLLALLAVRDALHQLRQFQKEMRQPAVHDLRLAIAQGDLARVRELIATGVNVNATDASGHSLLLDAALQHRAAIVEALQAAGARVGLLEACVLGDAEIVGTLLDGGADPNQKGRKGVTALDLAAHHGQTAIMRLLLDHGAEVDGASNAGHTPLMNAAFHHQQDAVSVLLAAGAYVGLSEAAMLGDIEQVRARLANGESIESRDRLGKTPLIAAAGTGQVGCVSALLDLGADIQATTPYGLTALDWAALAGSTQMIDLLLDRGMDVNARNTSDQKYLRGCTVLHWALLQPRSLDALRLLLARGADVNIADARGDVPLYEAVRKNNVEGLQLLLEAGADPNAKGPWQRTPLHHAADYGASERLEHVRLLLAHGADINARDEQGHTPLMLAAERGHKATVELLIQSGADINAKNNSGFTALSAAMTAGKTQIAQHLRDHGAEGHRFDVIGAAVLGNDDVLKAMGRRLAVRVLGLVIAGALGFAIGSALSGPRHSLGWVGAIGFCLAYGFGLSVWKKSRLVRRHGE